MPESFKIVWDLGGSSVLFGHLWPNIAVLAFLAIVGLALGSGSMLLSKARRLNAALHKGIDRLKLAASPVSEETLNDLHQYFSPNEYFKNIWREYRETLLNTNGTFYSTAQSERYFNEASLIDKNMLISFYTAVPGLLTALGLIGTFTAIYIALAQIPIVDGVVTNINPFIHSLSAKFISSIVGLLGAFSFIIFEKKVIGAMKRNLSEFQEALDALFETKPQEWLLSEVLHEMRLMKEGFAASLDSSLAVKVYEPLSQLAASSKELLELNQAAFERRDDLLSGLVSQIAVEFRKALTEAANEDIQKLADSMALASARTEDLKDKVSESLGQLQELVSAQKTQLESLLAFQKEQTELVVKNQIAQFDGLSESHSEKMKQLLADFNGAIEIEKELLKTSCQSVSENLSSWQNTQKQLADEMLVLYKKELETSLQESRNSQQQMLDRQLASAEISQGRINAAVEESAARISEMSSQGLSRLSELYERIASLSGNWSETVAANFKEIIESAGTQAGQSKDLSVLMQTAVDKLSATLSEAEESKKIIAAMSDSLLKANQAVASSELAMRKSNNETKLSVEAFQEQMHAYQGVLKSQHEIWTEQKGLLEALTVQIPHLVTALKAGGNGVEAQVQVSVSGELS